MTIEPWVFNFFKWLSFPPFNYVFDGSLADRSGIGDGDLTSSAWDLAARTIQYHPTAFCSFRPAGSHRTSCRKRHQLARRKRNLRASRIVAVMPSLRSTRGRTRGCRGCQPEIEKESGKKGGRRHYSSTGGFEDGGFALHKIIM